MQRGRRFCGGVLWFTAALTASASAQERLVVSRLQGPIELDGFSDEAAWQTIEPLPMVMFQPTFGLEPTERTEVFVGYDDNHLFFAGRFYDSDPSGVRANTLYRDRWSGDDTFGIILDTFNDNETGLWFFTTPAGNRVDGSIANDGAEFPSFSWDAFWDVAVKQTDEGWFAEMRVPFSTLGFQEADGRVVIGLIAYRYIARKNERAIFPPIDPMWNFRQPSLARDIVLHDVHSSKPVHVIPYVLGGIGQTSVLDDGGESYRLEDDVRNEVGGDMRYNVTSTLTLDLTVNTDFAQVEADDQQVNLTRFSLFFPEKRQFFLDRAAVFEFRTGGLDRLFHSRRIGLNDGRPVRIYGGVRLVGREGDWDIGLLNMQTARTDRLPSENFGVARVRRQVLNPYSYAGTMITTRLGEDGSYNIAYGFDAVLRLIADEYLTVQWAQSFDNQFAGNVLFDAIDGGLFRAQWQRRREVGWRYTAGFRWSGPTYEPGVGFVTRRDFKELTGNLQYGWFASPESALRSITPLGLLGAVAFRNEDGSIQTAVVEEGVNFEWKTGATLRFEVEWNLEDLRAPLLFPENTVVPAGRYDFASFGINYEMPQGQLLRTSARTSIGTFYDGRIFVLGLEPRWNVSRFLELGGVYEGSFARFPDRDQGFDAHLVRLRIQAAVNTKASVNAFVQYNSAADIVTTNVRFRYNFRERTDLWLVYDEGTNLDRRRVTPFLPVTSARAILVKYTHTFTLH